MSHEKYIKKYKKDKLLVILTRIFIILLFIIIWQYLANNNYINSFITSSPKNIINTLIILYKNNNLFIHIFTTIYETIISFIITSILSIIFAIIFYNNNFLSKVLDPFLTMLNSLPKVALGPIIIIWVGANTKGIITISVLISIIISLQNILNGFQNTDKNKIKLLQTFNANKYDIMTNLILPDNKKLILNTFKINISMCLIGVITGEFLTSKKGIGYLILYGSQVFDLNLVMSGLFILLIISITMYELIIFLIKK